MEANEYEAMLEMLGGKAGDAAEAPESLLATIGAIQVGLAGLTMELGKREADQDADHLCQLLLDISCVALLGAAAHVLPALETQSE
jgi:hypothetical protein